MELITTSIGKGSFSREANIAVISLLSKKDKDPKTVPTVDLY